MASKSEIESARLQMMEARQQLEDYEKSNGVGSSPEHSLLTRAFATAAKDYLRLTASQR